MVMVRGCVQNLLPATSFLFNDSDTCLLNKKSCRHDSISSLVLSINRTSHRGPSAIVDSRRNKHMGVYTCHSSRLIDEA